MKNRNKTANRKPKAIKWIFLVVFIGFILLNIVTYNHAYHFTHFSSLETKKTKVEQLGFLQKMKLTFVGVKNPKPVNASLPDSPYKTVSLESHEKLEAWFINQDSVKNGIVILFHGYSGSKSGMLNYSKEFEKLGFATFLVDFMGSGGSEGNQTTIGFKESRDVKKAYNYVLSEFPNSKIILFGSSMGAVSIMKAVVDFDLKPDKLILECPFGEMRTTVQKRFEIMQIPSFILADLLLFYGGLQNDFNP
jgi:pimeloyl-ACP methyl ester carboxylesterase